VIFSATPAQTSRKNFWPQDANSKCRIENLRRPGLYGFLNFAELGAISLVHPSALQAEVTGRDRTSDVHTTEAAVGCNDHPCARHNKAAGELVECEVDEGVIYQKTKTNHIKSLNLNLKSNRRGHPQLAQQERTSASGYVPPE
jgi:hypothetical protein